MRPRPGTAPAKGTIAFQNDGNFTYTPTATASGSDSFILTVSDGFSAPIEHRFVVTIASGNSAPVANADSGFALYSGQGLTITGARLLGNDHDADGQVLAITSVTDGIGGTVRKTSNGGVYFRADDDFSGLAVFQYEVSDGRGGTANASVSVHVVAAAASNQIVGTAGKDMLFGTRANEVFIGRAGSDTFVFRPNQGLDQISDFETGDDLRGAIDVLDLRGNGFTGYLDLLDNISASGSDTLITLDHGGSIRLKGVGPDTLLFDNFKIL